MARKNSIKTTVQPHWYEVIPEIEMETLLQRAEMFIAKQHWTFDDFDRDDLMYKTAFYLWSIDSMIAAKRKYPCYVVHGADDDQRFESDSRQIAFAHFKRLSKVGDRVGMFYWEDAYTQKRLYATDDYPFSRDFGPREE